MHCNKRSPNSQEDEKLKQRLLDCNMRDCRVLLKDIKLDKSYIFVNDTVNINDRRNKFTCYICMAKFPTSKDLSKHKSLHSGSEESESEDDLFEEEVETLKSKSSPRISAQKQESKINLTKTIETHQKSSDNVSADKQEKQENILSEDSVIETPFKCETCQVFFKTGDDAKFHKPSNKCKFSCKICRRKFNTLYAFVVHVMQHKANTEKSSRMSAHYAYKCTLCEKLFDDCYQLRRHENITHNIKPSRTSNNLDSSMPPLHFFEQESTATNSDICASQNIGEVTSELQSNASVGEETEIICDLCYDVFNSKEELDSHVDFHKQLENKSDTITIEDDEDEVVEVIEEKIDSHDIRATIKSKSLLKSPMPSTSSNKYATLTPIYTINNDSTHQSNVPVSKESNKPAVSNQLLTASITDMLTPTHEKQSKAILLENVSGVPTLMPINKPKIASTSLQQTPSDSTDNLELRKTGPTSYSFIYKGNTKRSSKSTKILPKMTHPQVLSTGTANDKTNYDSTVSSLPRPIQTEEIRNISDANRNTNNYNVVITASSSPSTNLVINTSSSPNIVQNTSTVTTLLPMMTSGGTASTTNFILTTNNNRIVQNVPTSVSSVLPSIPGSNIASTNFAYVINPTINPPNFPQISGTFTDPSTKIAYVIIPHGNNVANVSLSPSTVQSTVANRLDSNTETETAGVSTITSNLTEKRTENTVTIPVEKSNTEPMQQSIHNTPSSLSSSKNDNPYDIQIPLITNVTSLHGESNYKENTFPVITNVTSVISSDENSTNSIESPATTITTTANSKSISSYMISTPGPSSERDESAIIIDSDSSRDSTEDKSKPTKITEEKSGNASADEDGLIIDEDQKAGLIFVRKLTDLMEPQKADKEINQDETADNEKKKEKLKFPMNCDGCSVVFQRHKAMRNHNERKLKCALCDFKCCKVVNLKEHYILEHRKFFCGRCSFLASNKNQFKEHNSTKHTCNSCTGLYANLSTHICSTQKDKQRK